MFVLWLTFILTFFLLFTVSLTSAANGAGPSALSPVQTALKPVAVVFQGIIGAVAIAAVIWGAWGVITTVLGLLSNFRFDGVLKLLANFLLIVLGSLAGYTSVAAFFGAPASGAGKGIDWNKRTFGGIEAILGLIGMLLALWFLLVFILNRAGVYSVGVYMP